MYLVNMIIIREVKMDMEWSIHEVNNETHTIGSILTCRKEPKIQQFGCINAPLFLTIFHHYFLFSFYSTLLFLYSYFLLSFYSILLFLYSSPPPLLPSILLLHSFKRLKPISVKRRFLGVFKELLYLSELKPCHRDKS